MKKVLISLGAHSGLKKCVHHLELLNSGSQFSWIPGEDFGKGFSGFVVALSFIGKPNTIGTQSIFETLNVVFEIPLNSVPFPGAVHAEPQCPNNDDSAEGGPDSDIGENIKCCPSRDRNKKSIKPENPHSLSLIV
jgi:hypothetical protein